MTKHSEYEVECMEESQAYERKFLELIQEYPLHIALDFGYLDSSDIRDELISQLWDGVKEKIAKSTSDYDAANAVSELMISTGLVKHASRYACSLEDVDLTPKAVINKIQELGFYRKSLSHYNKIAEHVYYKNPEKLQQAIMEFSELRLNTDGGMKSGEEVHDEFAERINNGTIAIPWAIAGMDFATGGKERKTLNIIAARPGMGKTAIALQAARNDSHKFKVGFFQLEMGATSMWARIACPSVGVAWKDVISNKITDSQKQQLIIESKKLAVLHKDLFIDDTPGLTTSEVYQKSIQNQLDVIYIDHLWLLGDKGDSEVQRLGDVTMRLKNMAKSLDIPVVLLVQLSRGLEKRASKVPVLSDMRDSGKIEETADNVMMLYRETYYNPEGDDTTELWIRKFRNGEANVAVYMSFDQKNQWFDKPEQKEVEIPGHWSNDI